MAVRPGASLPAEPSAPSASFSAAAIPAAAALSVVSNVSSVQVIGPGQKGLPQVYLLLFTHNSCDTDDNDDDEAGLSPAVI
jgi:hypothetical protein